MRQLPLLAALATLALAAPAWAGTPRIESHDLEISIDPAARALTGTDRMSVARDGGGTFEFRLHRGLDVLETVIDGRTTTATRKEGSAGLDVWAVDVTPGPGGRASLVVTYAGKLGVITELGADLSRASGFYPDDGSFALFSVAARAPAPYIAITQGTLRARTKEEDGTDLSLWQGKLPSEGLALAVGRWRYTSKKSGRVTVGAYLTARNTAASESLLDATADALADYARWLGPLPHDRCDLVEGWLPGGSRAPGFTVLGTRTMGLLRKARDAGSPIPQEFLDAAILHNWWGNGVFPEPGTGSWCKGLARFCADHVAAEKEAPERARAVRLRAAVRFSLEVDESGDEPVRASRDDEIGRGKCAMVFNMLRREVGDDAFWETLRSTARGSAGKRIGWDGLRAAFEQVSGRNLTAFFGQWLDRKGAPQFALADARLDTTGGRLRVKGTVRQVLADGERPWNVSVPVVIEHLEGREVLNVQSASEATSFSALLPSMPLAVEIDPDHDVFRRFPDIEVPPCLAATLARPDVVVVHPDDDVALKAFATELAARSNVTAVAGSAAPKTLPVRKSFILLGGGDQLPLFESLRPIFPDAFLPALWSGPSLTVFANHRSPVDAREFVTTFETMDRAAAARSRTAFGFPYDGVITLHGDELAHRAASRRRNACRANVLPDLSQGATPMDAGEIVARLASADMKGRLAGSPEDRKARAYVTTQLAIAGLSVRERGFSFVVKDWPADRSALDAAGQPVVGAVPLVASPETARGGVAIARTSGDPGDDLAGKALLVDLPAGSEAPLDFARGMATIAKQRGASALLLRLPEIPTPMWHINALLAFPTTLAAEELTTPPAVRAARIAARTGSTEELALPTVAVPHGWTPPDTAFTVKIDFDERTVETANVVGRLRAPGGNDKRPVLIGAQLDHLGPGSTGAETAAGVAAALEAAAILGANADSLGRDVLFVFFGAEEWGLRGSSAFLSGKPDNALPTHVAAVDAVGRPGVETVHVLGAEQSPRLARIVGAALEQSALAVGTSADPGDRRTFREAGIRAVRIRCTGPPGSDAVDQVDPANVSKIARALAMTALALAGGL